MFQLLEGGGEGGGNGGAIAEKEGGFTGSELAKHSLVIGNIRRLGVDNNFCPLRRVGRCRVQYAMQATFQSEAKLFPTTWAEGRKLACAATGLRGLRSA